jgi:hypothetical protein
MGAKISCRPPASDDGDDHDSKRLREGDRIEAKCTGWTKFYPAKVTYVNSDGTYDIKCDDGERKRGVRRDQIRRLNSEHGRRGSAAARRRRRSEEEEE